MTEQKDLLLTQDELKSVKTGLNILKTRDMRLTSTSHLVQSDKMLRNLEGILKKYQAALN